jgi:hypothetical protein
LQALLERAGARPQTVEERERRILSFAYGNLRMEDSRVTREMIAAAAKITTDQE